MIRPAVVSVQLTQSAPLKGETLQEFPLIIAPVFTQEATGAERRWSHCCGTLLLEHRSGRSHLDSDSAFQERVSLHWGVRAETFGVVASGTPRPSEDSSVKPP